MKKEIKQALKFTEKVEKDIDIPKYEDGIVNGWSYNAYSVRVEKSCSSYVSHGSWGWDNIKKKRPIKQFSSELKAYQALRNELEEKYAQQLYDIDLKIKELKK